MKKKNLYIDFDGVILDTITPTYEEMEKVILINILGYDMFPELKEDYIHKTAIVLDRHRDYTVMDNIEWWFIELSKFRKIRPDMNEKINQWLAFIDDEDKEMISMAEEKNKTLKKAREEMEYLTGDEEVKRLAELREKWEMDRNSEIGQAKKEGISERNIQIAQNMLKDGMNLETVMKYTGLSKKEVEELLK